MALPQHADAAFPDLHQVFQPNGIKRHIIKPINDLGLMVALDPFWAIRRWRPCRHAKEVAQALPLRQAESTQKNNCYAKDRAKTAKIAFLRVAPQIAPRPLPAKVLRP
jgi:hypothetical protein